jgi:hypothetical protein
MPSTLVEVAIEIEAEHEALDRRRADLDALAGMLTTEGRRLNRVPPRTGRSNPRLKPPAALIASPTEGEGR